MKYLWSGALVDAAFAAVVVALAVLNAAHATDRAGKRLFNVLFLVSLVLFAVSSFLYLSTGQLTAYWLSWLEDAFAYACIFMVLALTLSAALFIKDRRIKAALAIAIIAIVVVFYLHYVIYAADDETVIGYYAVQHMLQGINPYTTSISQTLFTSNVTTGRITFTQDNTVIGAVDYPALYFLVSVPFYLAFSGYGFQAIAQLYMHTQAVVFFLIFIGALALVMKKDEPFRPNFAAYVLFGAFSMFIASMQTFLMLALVLLLYTAASKKYSWLIIGLAVSLQELLWPIMLLFIVYTINNKGWRSGIREIVGAGAIFMLINGYFIISAPYSYISSVLLTVGNILPQPSSSIGYLIASQYPIGMHSYPILIALSTALMVIVSLYANDRRAIPLLAMIPLLFINHLLLVYYILLALLFTLVCRIDSGHRPIGRFRSYVNTAAGKAAAYVATLVVIAAIVAVVALSHASYESGFSIHLYNQTAELQNNGTVLYRADVLYGGPGTSAYLAFMIEYQGQGGLFYGLSAQRLFKGSLNCAAYPCATNPNLMHLSNGIYALNATIPSNITAGTAYLNTVIYNSGHYYVGPSFTVTAPPAR